VRLVGSWRSSPGGSCDSEDLPRPSAAPRLTLQAALAYGAYCNAAFPAKLTSSCRQSHATLNANIAGVLLCDVVPHHGFGCDVAASIGFQRAISERTKRSNAAGVRSPLAGMEAPS